MNNIYTIRLSNRALKDIKNIPIHAAVKLHSWIDEVISHGLNEARKNSSFCDKPLRGDRTGQHAIKLSEEYRAVYTIEKDNSIRFIEILLTSALY